MSRAIKIDFYRVVVPETAKPFHQIVSDVLVLPYDSRIVELKGNNPIRLQDGSCAEERVECDMVRIRMEEVPKRASLSGDLEPFDLDDDEGVGEESAFLFDTHTQILALQRNRSGVSASALATYFTRIAETEDPIVLEPVLRPDAISRLYTMRTIRRFRVRIAQPNAKAFREIGQSVDQMIDLIRGMHSPQIDVAFSMSRQRGTLPLDRIRSMARDLLRIGQTQHEQVKHIEISGKDNEGESDRFDLMDYRMIESIDVEPDENRTLPYDGKRGRKRALHVAWKRCRSELNEIYKLEG